MVNLWRKRPSNKSLATQEKKNEARRNTDIEREAAFAQGVQNILSATNPLSDPIGASTITHKAARKTSKNKRSGGRGSKTTNTAHRRNARDSVKSNTSDTSPITMSIELNPKELAKMLKATAEERSARRRHRVYSLRRADGGKYRGEAISGIPNGKGKDFTADGFLFYEGQYRHGVPDGEGTYVWPDGTTYVGTFKAGIPQGQGLERRDDGTVYVGTYVYLCRMYIYCSGNFVLKSHSFEYMHM
jgi:hypothetical protein